MNRYNLFLKNHLTGFTIDSQYLSIINGLRTPKIDSAET